MGRGVIAIFSIIIVLAGCDDKDKQPKNSGTVTIDNTLFGAGPYYAVGFNFALAEKVSSSSTPKPDIILELGGSLDNFILQTQPGVNAFSLAGDYPSEAAAIQAFNSLTSPVVNDWEDWANPVRVNQVWVYRSADEHFAKIRIISLLSEDRDPRDYAECTFEWVYQPDGSLTFPGK
jgi:hypothetical protein